MGQVASLQFSVIRQKGKAYLKDCRLFHRGFQILPETGHNTGRMVERPASEGGPYRKD